MHFTNRKLFWTLIVLLTIGVGCSKWKDPISPQIEEEPTVEPSKLAIYATDEENQAPLEGVVVEEQYWDNTRVAWPSTGNNYTPIAFNEIEPGSHTFIGSKEGYVGTPASVTIVAGQDTTIWLVMHKAKPGYGRLTVLSTGSVGKPMDEVAIFTQEGTPPALYPWPNAQDNITPINPNWVEPGSYLIVGQKEHYVDGWTYVEVEDGESVVAYVVMWHNCDSTSVPPTEDGPQGRIWMKADAEYLYQKGEGGVIGACGYNWNLWNGSNFSMDTTKISEQECVDGWLRTKRADLRDPNYPRFTIAFGQMLGHQYYYQGRNGYEVILEGGLEVDPEDQNWWRFTETPAPVNDSWVDLQVDPDDCTQLMDGQPWPEGIEWLSTGNHTVVVSKDGYISQTVDFVTVADETTLVVVSLEPEPAQKSALELTVSPQYCTILLDSLLWNEGWSEISPGNHTLVVSKTDFVTETRNFSVNPGETAYIDIVLQPVPSALRVEYDSTSTALRLYGDGHENWLGVECYDPDQNEVTGWLVNHWIGGTDQGDYTEFIIADSRLDHVVIWADCVPGPEGSGGSGIAPRFTAWATLEQGDGIEHINTDPGYLVLDR